jgi:hypothetical protein
MHSQFSVQHAPERARFKIKTTKHATRPLPDVVYGSMLDFNEFVLNYDKKPEGRFVLDPDYAHDSDPDSFNGVELNAFVGVNSKKWKAIVFIRGVEHITDDTSLDAIRLALVVSAPLPHSPI